MAQPGSTSGITALTTGVWSLLMITVLISGHLGMILVIYNMLAADSNLNKMFAEMVNLPIWTLWLSIASTLAMDAWIYLHIYKGRKKALAR